MDVFAELSRRKSKTLFHNNSEMLPRSNCSRQRKLLHENKSEFPPSPSITKMKNQTPDEVAFAGCNRWCIQKSIREACKLQLRPMVLIVLVRPVRAERYGHSGGVLDRKPWLSWLMEEVDAAADCCIITMRASFSTSRSIAATRAIVSTTAGSAAWYLCEN